LNARSQPIAANEKLRQTQKDVRVVVSSARARKELAPRRRPRMRRSPAALELHAELRGDIERGKGLTWNHRNSLSAGKSFFLSCGFFSRPQAAERRVKFEAGGSFANAPGKWQRAATSAALKGVLSAACSQNQTEFVRFLTARNREALPA